MTKKVVKKVRKHNFPAFRKIAVSPLVVFFPLFIKQSGLSSSESSG